MDSTDSMDMGGRDKGCEQQAKNVRGKGTVGAMGALQTQRPDARTQLAREGAERTGSGMDAKKDAKMDAKMDTKKVLLVSSGHLSCDINAGALPAIIPYLRDAFALSYQATGGIMFAFSLLSAITQPIFGILSDRFTRPWLAVVGVLLAGMGLAFTGLAGNYWGVLAAVAVCGLGSALFHPTGARFVNLAGGEHKGFALSIFSTSGNAGFVLGPLVAAGLMTLYGLSGTLFFGFLALATALALGLTISRMGKAEGGSRESEGGAGSPLQNNWIQFNRLTVAIVTRTIVLSSIHAYLPLYWMHVLGQSRGEGVLAVTLFGLVGVLSNMSGGWLSDRQGRGRVLHLSFLPLAPALLVFSLTDSMALAWGMLAILAFCLYFGFSTMVVLGQQFLARNMGFASGITLGLSTAVGGLCAPFLGWVGDTWGLPASFQAMAGLAVIATITCFFVDANANAPTPPRAKA